MNPRLASLAAAAVLLAVPPVAQAQKEQYTYRCVGKDGKKYYGSTIPQACLGMPLELINRQGLVVKRIDPEGDEKAKLAKEEALTKKREAEFAAKEQQRRNRALLATYNNEKEIEDARNRALQDHQKQVNEIVGRIDEIKRRQQRFDKDLELFKASGKGEAPQRLKEEITNAAIDLKAQTALLEAKKKDADGINARYDEDKRRYKEATSGKKTP